MRTANVLPSAIFSYTFSAHEGTAYKARDTLSKRFFSQVTYAKYAPIAKNHFSSSDTPSLRCVLLRLLTRKKKMTLRRKKP